MNHLVPILYFKNIYIFALLLILLTIFPVVFISKVKNHFCKKRKKERKEATLTSNVSHCILKPYSGTITNIIN